MNDINQVFARFRDDSPDTAPQREVLSIPRRGNACGARTVEVVHVKSGRPSAPEKPQRDTPHRDTSVRAAVWSDGFPAKTAPTLPPAEPPAASEPPPTVHVMPMWEPSHAPDEAPAPEAQAPKRRGRPPRQAALPEPTRRPVRSADPFDHADEGANCLRCGYLVEPARESRGLLTCAACA